MMPCSSKLSRCVRTVGALLGTCIFDIFTVVDTASTIQLHDLTMLCTTVSTTTAVLPSIVDSVRDLRKINSNLLSDLQQSFCETINQNILLVDENTKLRTDSSQVHMDISKLQPTLQLLNDVSYMVT